MIRSIYRAEKPYFWTKDLLCDLKEILEDFKLRAFEVYVSTSLSAMERAKLHLLDSLVEDIKKFGSTTH